MTPLSCLGKRLLFPLFPPFLLAVTRLIMALHMYYLQSFIIKEELQQLLSASLTLSVLTGASSPQPAASYIQYSLIPVS